METKIPVSVPHKRQGKFIALAPISIEASVYFDNTGSIYIAGGCSFSRGVCILTHEHDHSRGVDILDSSIRIGSIEIDSGVFIGMNAIITASCRRIGEGAVVGAGSVVTKDVPPYEIWAGNPACKIGERK